jgi:hypothetical protein
MKIAVVFISILVSTIAFSQEQSVTFIPKNSMSASGFRVSVLVSSLSIKYKFDDALGSGTASYKINSSTGFGIGYAYLPAYSFGWTGNLSYFELRDNGSINLARADLNLAYSFNSTLNLKAGINGGKFTSENVSKDVNSKVGYQVSFGVQATQNIGFDIGMTDVKFDLNQFGGKEDIDLTGTEIGLTATF